MPFDYPIGEQIHRAWVSYRTVRNQHSTEHIHIARYIRPELAEWFEESRTSDRPAIEKLWDDTPIQANDMWARGIWALSTNSSTRWFAYSDHNTHVMNDSEAKSWYAMVNRDLDDELKESGCYPALLARLSDTGAFGYGALYSYEDPEDASKIIFEWVPASECFYTVGRNGLANSFIRPLNLTAQQAIDERGWPAEKLDQSVRDAYQMKNYTQKFLFLHVVWERKSRPKDRKPMHRLEYKWAGYYYQVANRSVIDEHGFRDFPYHVLGWQTISNVPYPVGIGYRTLPEIRNLNAMRRDYDRIVGLEADSPVLTPNMAEQPGGEQFRPNRGDMIVGGMSGDGKRLYDMLYNGNGGRSLLEEIKDSREIIRSAWHYSLFLMQTQQRMTAEEVRSRDAKLIQAMGPFIVLMAADLRSVIERVFFTRLAAGQYDPLPAVFDKNTKMKLKFSGILAKAQEVLEGQQIVELLAEGQVIAQYDPQAVLQGTDLNAAWRHLASSKSIPSDIVFSKEQYEENLKADQQRQQAAAAAAAAPDLAKAAKDGTEALRNLNDNGKSNSKVVGR